MVLKKQIHNIVICSVILTLLIIIMILLISKPNEELTETQTSENVNVLSPFIQKNLNEISCVYVKNSEGEFTIYAKSTDDETVYTIPDLDPEKISKKNMEDFLNGILILSPIQIANNDASDLSIYGLDKEKATITVSDVNDEKYIMRLGDAAPLAMGSYLKIGDENKVYLISPFNSELFKHDKNFFIEEETSAKED